MTARYLAVKALMRQEQAGYANLVLDAELKKCSPPLSPRDAAFAASVFYTTLERKNLLDHCLNQFTKRPVGRLDAPVRAILRAGLAQARFMDVPLPAAVNESVKLAKAFGKTSAAGMVNAVLRRAAGLAVSPQDFADPLACLQTYYSLSAPVASLLWGQYGPEALAMAEAFFCRLPTAIRVNPLTTSDDALTNALIREGHSVTPGPWAHCLLVDFQGSPAASKAFQQGHFHVQGLASQYAALCVGARPGDRVLDCCAAPGGKSLTLAQQMHNRGLLRSGEVVPGRVGLLQKAFARCGVTCTEAVCADAAQPRPPQERYDRILCDVPCSGLGVIAKKPDIRYKALDGMEALVHTQQKILQNAAQSLAENGRLVYSTCTVNRQENEEQIRSFLATHPDFRVMAPPLGFPGAEATGEGTLFLPHKTGTDGFFVAVLERKR
ncbi:MAG: 16S rRNA (cytosine(967)-C(5))-methyltransferase RsmB [Gemmiger sp.]